MVVPATLSNYPGATTKNLDGDAGGLDIALTQKKLNLNLTLDEYLTAVQNQPKPLVIPLCAELPLPRCSPLDVISATRTGSGFLLESIEGSEKIARYSYIGTNPLCTITCGAEISILGTEPFVSICKNPEGTNPVDQIRSVLSRFHYVNVRAPRFFGGLVGYFSYDTVYSLFPQVRKAGSDPAPRNPDARFLLVKDCIVFDHHDKKLFIFDSPFLTYESDPSGEYRSSARHIDALSQTINAIEPSTTTPREPAPPQQKFQPVSDNTGKTVFKQSVGRVKEHIIAGDIFQAVISRRMECPFGRDPFPVYTALREINPSPYMYFLDFGDEQVIGASPEMLVRVERRRVTTVPIAGTRPRGESPEEDQRFADELRRDAKECAEHTMLVDLARNDLGRVSKFGSVQVGEFMNIEKFSHVQHLVSTVHGVLADHLDCYDALKSCFPAGTVSGAPKIRAMQIIEETEPENRGIYAGAVGYTGFDRNLEFAIAIRTVIVRDGKAQVQVGAGIVADSVPENEWNETETKAAAMMRAIARAGMTP